MLKKVLVGSAVAALFATFVFGREACSYLRTGARNIRQAVKAEVPVEFEIQRARSMVEELVPDIRRCMHVIAEQQVDIEHLDRQIARRETEMERQKTSLMSLKSDVASGRSVFVYAGRSYSVSDVKRDLSTRFDRYKSAEDLLNADRKILAARQQNLAANSEKLQGMMQAKKDLEVKLEQLQARIETIRAAETVSTLAIDDSNLSHAKRLIDDLNKALDVKQKVLDAEGKFAGLIPVDLPAETPVQDDITDQIEAYFQAGPVDAASVVKAE